MDEAQDIPMQSTTLRMQHWRIGNNLLFHEERHPGSLFMNLLESITFGSGMVVEDHGSNEGVILKKLESYDDGNKRYGLPNKSILDRRPQFKQSLGFELTTSTAHYAQKNGISERTNSQTWKLFFPILEYSKKPYMTHKLVQQKLKKQIPKQERLFEKSKKPLIF